MALETEAFCVTVVDGLYIGIIRAWSRPGLVPAEVGQSVYNKTFDHNHSKVYLLVFAVSLGNSQLSQQLTL